MDNTSNFFSKLNLSTLSIPNIRITDIIDIVLVAGLIYVILMWIKRTRAWSLFKGIVVIVLISFISYQFHFYTISWIIEKTLSVGIIAIVILFQPEFRKALEQLGKGSILTGLFGNSQEESGVHIATINAVVDACVKMSKVKTGALIVIERDVPTGDLTERGIEIDARVSSSLLINIFEDKTPLHDGAVIIRNNRIAAATCILPLTNGAINKELGTRHRAAVGATEVSDAIVVVVSEETGVISLAVDGELIRHLDEKNLRNTLEKYLKYNNAVSRFNLIKRRYYDEKK